MDKENKKKDDFLNDFINQFQKLELKASEKAPNIKFSKLPESVSCIYCSGKAYKKSDYPDDDGNFVYKCEDCKKEFGVIPPNKLGKI